MAKYDETIIEDARRKCEAARKAEAEGSPGLAGQFYMQAADRFRAAGLTILAKRVRKMAEGCEAAAGAM